MHHGPVFRQPRPIRSATPRLNGVLPRIVPASEIARTGGGPNDLALTFDDGLMSVATTAAPILAEYGVPWSMFVVSNWADGLHTWDQDVLLGWREIERLAAAGAEIGSHSASHPDFRWLGVDAM